MRSFLLAIFVVIVSCAQGQSYDSDRRGLSMFVQRMYEHEPFEGVRVLNNHKDYFLISVLSLNATDYAHNMDVMSRVASVKASAQANKFFSGSNITSDLIVSTQKDSKDSKRKAKIIEVMKEHSVGYMPRMEQLTTFKSNAGKYIFVYMTQINDL